jgi:hypothetical protein
MMLRRGVVRALGPARAAASAAQPSRSVYLRKHESEQQVKQFTMVSAEAGEERGAGRVAMGRERGARTRPSPRNKHTFVIARTTRAHTHTARPPRPPPPH